MTKSLTFLLVCCSLLLAGGCVPGSLGGTVTESFEETVPLEPDGALEIENVNGHIYIETWDRPEVHIQAEKKASSEDKLDQIEIDIRTEGNRVAVKTRLPKSIWGFIGSGKGSVDYHLVTPETARVSVSTVNGKVEIEGVAGSLRAKSVNGPVRVADAAGTVDASTVNGGIHVRYLELPGEGRHKYSTVNGGVEVVLPAWAEGDFSAKTVNGAIDTDFPLDVTKPKWGPKHLEGRLGEGGGHFDFKTVNGSVKILKREDQV